jgi:pyruvate formate lyase activating enzyme
MLKRVRRKAWILVTLLIIPALLYPLYNLGYSSGTSDIITSASPKAKKESFLREAMFYKVLAGDEVQCQMCFRKCIIPEGRRGACRNRENRKGKLYSVVYGRPSAVHIDPIEKEPQYHFLPGSEILCIGTAGCNFRCRHCHNWHLSQRSIEEMAYVYDLMPEKAVEQALKNKIPTMSFTYNEPTSFYEYVYDIAKLAKEKGLRIIWHSNGALNPAPLKELLKYTDGVTIDLKGFSQRAYDNSSAELEPVLRTLKIIKKEGKWLEIVNLVIPTINDDLEEIRKMCGWIKENLGVDVPLHFSRFFPAYRLTQLPPTPISTLEKAYEIARKVGLNYVSIGNVPGHKYNSTFCPKCGKKLIHRTHFIVLSNDIEDGKCRFCGQEVPGIWK